MKKKTVLRGFFMPGATWRLEELHLTATVISKSKKSGRVNINLVSDESPRRVLEATWSTAHLKTWYEPIKRGNGRF